jgi:endoglycosylceramidase
VLDRAARRVLAAVLASAALGACGGDGAPRTHPLWADGPVLRDADGRVALLRGVNARVDGVFDVTFADGRTALEPIPALDDGDCTRMRQLGLDLLRLPINWSGIEPTRGSYDEAYLGRVDAAVQCAARAGVLVVIDLHQDAYSKEIGEDGAPLWAIQPAPTDLLEGPLTDLGDRRLSRPVQDAFTTFFAVGDPSGLQADYGAMLAHVAARWADDPAVVGFELYNEPDTGAEELDPFQAAAAAAVRAAAPDTLVFFEPPTLRNLTDFVPESKTPFAVTGAVYAPHVYTFVFQPDPTAFDTFTADQLEPSVSAARGEADAWQTPLFIGEYGVGPGGGQNDLWMETEAVLHDRYLASDAFWVWKEQSQGSWGLFDHDDTTGAWTERPQVVGWVSRLHAARIGGDPTAVDYDPTAQTLHVELAPGSATDAPTLVYVPERLAGGYQVRCDGAGVAAPRDPATGLVSVACGGMLDVGPTP